MSSHINAYLKLLAPNEQISLLADIKRLKRIKEFSTFIDFLNGLVNSIDQLNRTAEPPQLQWNQGAAQLLEELTEQIRDAEMLGNTLSQQLQAGEESRKNPGSFPE